MPEVHRPQFRNIHITQIAKYRLPIAGIVSILHRVSGLLMFLLVPFMLYLLEQSLTSPSTFWQLKECVQNPIVKLVILGMSWAYLHHFCAGIRHLVMDLHIGLDKYSSLKSALAVFFVSITLAGLIALKLFGVF